MTEGCQLDDDGDEISTRFGIHQYLKYISANNHPSVMRPV
jgi:hypothetical protein